MSNEKQLESFLNISAWLTGYDRARLDSTGLTSTYFHTLKKHSDTQTLVLFEQQALAILQLAQTDPDQAKVATQSWLMQPSNYNATAQKIILMWYTGQWFDDITGDGKQISGQSYVQSLMWPTAQVHPPAAKQPGFASWSQPPIVIQNN